MLVPGNIGRLDLAIPYTLITDSSMTEILKQQYALVKSSREVVFNFIETEVKEDLYTPVALCNFHTIGYLLEHNAGCYRSWLAGFAKHADTMVTITSELVTMEMIRQIYIQVDGYVEGFIKKFEHNVELPISLMHDACGQVSTTPLKLLTHVMTHEFHHKGQVMIMCRILGHTPPDTDISLFFSETDSP